jgi:hypothetical protein
LHVDGRYIKDDSGNIVFLRGVNKPGYEDDYMGLWAAEGEEAFDGFNVWNPQAIRDNFEAMQSWGCNVARIHQVVDFWQDNTQNYRQHIHDMIEIAGEYGIYVVFDVYSIRNSQVGGGDQFQIPWGRSGYGDPYLTGADATRIPNRAAYINYWVSVVNKLKDLPNVIFEFANEPKGWSAIDDYFVGVQEWIDAVRQEEGDGIKHLLVVQWDTGVWCNMDYPPPPWGDAQYPDDIGTLQWITDYPLNDPAGNIVYSTHIYREGGAFGDPQFLYKYNDVLLALQYQKVDWAAQNYPLFIGEVGARHNNAQDHTALNNTLTILKMWEVSYAQWTWTIEGHMEHGILQNEVFIPPPNEAGQILIDSLKP